MSFESILGNGRAVLTVVAIASMLSGGCRSTTEPLPVLLDHLPSDVVGLVCVRPGPILGSPIVRDLLNVIQEAAGDPGASADPVVEFNRLTGLDLQNRVDWICIATGRNREIFLLARGDIDLNLYGPVLKRIGRHALHERNGLRVVDFGRGLVGMTLSGGGAIEQLARAEDDGALASNEPFAAVLRGSETGRMVWGVITPPAVDRVPVGDLGQMLPASSLVPFIGFWADSAEQLTFAAVFHAADAPSASKIGDSLDQLLALARVFTARQPEVASLVETVSLAREETRVTLRADVPADLVAALSRAHTSRIVNLLRSAMRVSPDVGADGSPAQPVR